MGLSSYLRKVYDLDTLDTRFTSSTSVPYQTVIDARDDPAVEREVAARARSSAPPPKWRTPEFFLYYIVFIVVVPYMFWVAYDVSRREKAKPPVPLIWSRRDTDSWTKPLILGIPNMRNICRTDGSRGEKSTIPMRSTVRFETTSPS